MEGLLPDMNTLDNIKQIKKLDPGQVLLSIEKLASQVSQVNEEFKKISLPADFKKVDKIIVNGMGGSALGSHILRSLFFDQLKLPLGIINSYQLPASLDKNTLYIVSSYSGTTEEPLATIDEAKRKQAKIFGIASGGKLGELIKQKKIAGYVFDAKFNPSNQPRMGLGYSLAAQLALFKKLGLLSISEQQVNRALALVSGWDKAFGVNAATKNNPAKQLALKLKDKMPVIVTSEFLAGNAHTFANQINENAKTFANYFLISEMNHHLLEGLSFPKTNRQNLFFVFFDSRLYQAKNQIRYKITKQVVAKIKIPFFSYQLSSTDKISQVLEFLAFGSYASFYLGILNGVNPSKIPWVDYFKEQLKKAS